ncbi:MAG TPA: hypothetical protein VHW23_26950 [Kofleriaceae bacterium]|nr:hypothetical protein [Kofleriaceae bacterium]
MTCEHYWQDGILRVERGEHDPHRATCDDCQQAHRERALLVRALPEVRATSSGNPDWQSQVWRRIARAETSRARRSYWLGGALAAAGAAAAVALYLTRPQQIDRTVVAAVRVADADERPRVDIVRGPESARSHSARVGDRVQISVGAGIEVRVYRAERLVLRCPARQASPGCTPDAAGLIADAELTTAGEYQLVTITCRAALAAPAGALDPDLAAVVDAGGDYRLSDLSVR